MTMLPLHTEILVVEDEPLIGFEIGLILEEAGATVIGPLRTLAEALAMIRGSTPSAAILDMRLGADEIGPVAEALAAKGVPFVFHTGHGDASALGVWRDRPIIYKPAPPEQIIAAVLAVLDPRRPQVR
jgi:DNA-binding response OmpR family regulator